jgi:hypothetical protein
VTENSQTQQRAILVILLATSERALEAFQVAGNAADASFVADLERVIARTRAEIAALTEQKQAESA